MINIVDKKYSELCELLDKIDFKRKRNMAIYGMSRTVKLMDIFEKTADFEELIDLNKYCDLCEKLIETANQGKEYTSLSEIEQIVCDRSYMFLEYWFYFLQMNFINEDMEEDYARFILFPAEIIKEVYSSLNYDKTYDDVQMIINNNKLIIKEFELIDAELTNTDSEYDNFEKYINEYMNYDIIGNLA